MGNLRQLQSIFDNTLVGHLLAVVAGGLVTLSLAPFDYWFAGIAGVGLFAALLRKLNSKRATLRGWLFGAGLFGSGASWVYVSIHTYGYASPLLAAALTAIFCLGLALLSALFAWLYVRWIRDLCGGNWLGFAALWTLCEWLRSWLLTGFPWLFAGYAHLDSPLSGWAPVGGVYTLSFICAVSGAVLCQLHAWNNKQRHIGLATILGLWLTGWGLSHIEWTAPKGEPINVAMVQANIPQDQKWLPQQYSKTLSLYRQMSEALWSRNDLVVWPEAAIPGYYHNARHFLSMMAASAANSQSTLITGVPTRSASGSAHNSIIALNTETSAYHKQRLVPFGEYVPLESLLRGLIQFFDLPMSSFKAGADNQDPLRASHLTLAPLICYEIAYPDLVSRWLPQSDLLITISNDAWFGDSIGPLQHLQMAQMRALENGRDLIRSTGTGVTALTDHHGQITAQLPQFEQAVLSGTVQPRSGATPYAVTGSWPILLLCGLIVLCGVILSRKS